MLRNARPATVRKDDDIRGRWLEKFSLGALWHCSSCGEDDYDYDLYL